MAHNVFHPLHPAHTGKDETDAVAVRRDTAASHLRQCSNCSKPIQRPHEGFQYQPCYFELCSNCERGHAHAAHISHYLFLVNLVHLLWTCSGCNKTSMQLKETICYCCDTCKFYLCRSCFQPKKYLLHAHELTKTDVRSIYHGSQGRWMCDCCGGNNGLRNFLPRHCNICKFDLCEKCCEPHRSTLHLHDLYKVDTTLVYERFMGGWKCDNCGSRFHPQTNKYPYNCEICEFDLCNNCMRISDSKVAPRPFALNRSAIPPATSTTASGLPVASPQDDLINSNPVVPVEDDTLCIICLTKPKDATIIHGTTGHVCCCLDCAKELERRGDRCPICRERIQLVIQHSFF